VLYRVSRSATQWPQQGPPVIESKANGHRYSRFHAQQAIDYGKPNSPRLATTGRELSEHGI
jgi:hypothetical protein